jgi:hypothetical protein
VDKKVKLVVPEPKIMKSGSEKSEVVLETVEVTATFGGPGQGASCWRCGSDSHWKRDCPVPPKKPNTPVNLNVN